MNKDWLFVADNSICDARTVGVLVCDGKVLVQQDRNGNEYALHGGHVRIGEALADGPVREGCLQKRPYIPRSHCI